MGFNPIKNFTISPEAVQFRGSMRFGLNFVHVAGNFGPGVKNFGLHRSEFLRSKKRGAHGKIAPSYAKHPERQMKHPWIGSYFSVFASTTTTLNFAASAEFGVKDFDHVGVMLVIGEIHGSLSYRSGKWQRPPPEEVTG